LTELIAEASVPGMRPQVRAALVLLAVVVLAFGVWFGIREPSTARATVLYTDEPSGFAIYDQLPLRIGRSDADVRLIRMNPSPP
jgi:hypothetical protein